MFAFINKDIFLSDLYIVLCPDLDVTQQVGTTNIILIF